MKLRIKGNSVRIRLTRPEVEQFGKEGSLEEKTEFGNAVFSYILRSADVDKLSAGFAGNTITVYVPAAVTHEWTTTEKVGYDGNMDIGDGKQLYVLIEKDFKCIDNASEDQSDNYENPQLHCD